MSGRDTVENGGLGNAESFLDHVNFWKMKRGGENALY